MKLIDTSAWVHALRIDGDPSIRKHVEQLLRAGDACWCAMVRLELWSGARGRHEKNVLLEMEQVLPELETTQKAWNLACDLARRIRERGRTVPASDLVIAACARHHGVDVLHDDRHFEIISTIAQASVPDRRKEP